MDCKDEYLNFMTVNKISDGVLREFILKKKWKASLAQSILTRKKLKAQMEALDNLVVTIQYNQGENG